MSPSRLSSLIVKELLSYLRDPKSRITLIVPPLIQLLIFSFAATLEVRNVELAVLNEDHGRWSVETIARVEAASFVDRVVPVHRPEDLQDLLDTRRALLGLHFPEDFSRDVEAGRPARAQVLIDGRRANAGQIALGYLDTIAARLGEDLSFELRRPAADATGGPDGTVAAEPGATDGGAETPKVTVATPTTAPTLAVRHWFNPNLLYLWFIVPALAGILSMLLSLLVTALSIARERELGTFDQLLVSLVTPMEIIVGKTVPALLIGTVMGSFMIAAAVFFFRVPFTGSLGLLLVSLVLFILSVVGIGLMLSSICQTQQQAILGVFSILVPVILISGFATPVENMPGWLQVAAEASPLKHFLILLHGCFLKALPVSEIFANAWRLVAIAAVTLTLANFFVRRRLQ